MGVSFLGENETKNGNQHVSLARLQKVTPLFINQPSVSCFSTEELKTSKKQNLEILSTYVHLTDKNTTLYGFPHMDRK